MFCLDFLLVWFHLFGWFCFQCFLFVCVMCLFSALCPNVSAILVMLRNIDHQAAVNYKSWCISSLFAGVAEFFLGIL